MATIGADPRMNPTAGPRPFDAGADAAPASASDAGSGASPWPPRRMASRQATNTKYVSASIASTNGAPTNAISRPATPGPISPDRLNDSDSIAFAVISSSPRTSRVMRLVMPAALGMNRQPYIHATTHKWADD